MTSIVLKDITMFFKSSCCNQTVDPVHSSKKPCQSYAHGPSVEKLTEFFDQYTDNVYCFTVTIGVKKYGRLSSKDQYREILKSLKEYNVYCKSKKSPIYATFELTKAGVVHVHGIIGEHLATRAEFINIFRKFGSRNESDESYQRCKDTGAYIKYMLKEYSLDEVTRKMTHQTESYFKIYNGTNI